MAHLVVNGEVFRYFLFSIHLRGHMVSCDGQFYPQDFFSMLSTACIIRSLQVLLDHHLLRCIVIFRPSERSKWSHSAVNYLLIFIEEP